MLPLAKCPPYTFYSAGEDRGYLATFKTNQ